MVSEMTKSLHNGLYREFKEGTTEETSLEAFHANQTMMAST